MHLNFLSWFFLFLITKFLKMVYFLIFIFVASQSFLIWRLTCINICVQFSSVTQLYPTLCDSMDHSTPRLPVHHQLLESTQTLVPGVSDATQPSHPLSSPPPPALSLSQHQGLFQNRLCEGALNLSLSSAAREDASLCVLCNHCQVQQQLKHVQHRVSLLCPRGAAMWLFSQCIKLSSYPTPYKVQLFVWLCPGNIFLCIYWHICRSQVLFGIFCNRVLPWAIITVYSEKQPVIVVTVPICQK